MDTQMQIQSTPNPNALKFVLNRTLKTEGKVTLKNKEEAKDIPLAQLLFDIPNVKEVYFFDNYITITQDGNGDWDAIEEQVQDTILKNVDAHNPDFTMEDHVEQREQRGPISPELQKIEDVLDRTIRPALQMDGGDIRVVGLNDNIVQVYYQGACGTCPSAATGTLRAVEGILRDEINPDLVVEMADGM